MIGIFALIVAACGSNNTSINYRTNLGAYQPVTPNKGGTIIYSDWQAPTSVNPIGGLLSNSVATSEVVAATTDGCIFQLPDLSLKDAGWKPSQCTDVPTVANGGESKDAMSTTIHLDPKAKWSNGDQITADDYLFYLAVYDDPNIGGGLSPFDKATLTKVDQFTLRYDWGQPYAAYRLAITLPLHTGSSQGAWDSSKGCTSVSEANVATLPCYNTAAMQKLVATDAFNQTPVVNGAYTVQSYKQDDSIVFVPNANYYSRFFKKPAPDKVIFQKSGDKDSMIQAFLGGDLDKMEDLTVADLSKLSSLTAKELYVTQQFSYEHLEFNQRPEAPSAKANGGKSLFADANVRKAFIEGFDRCNAITTVLGVDCNNAGIKTNEVTVPLDPAYDTAAPFPTYNPTDAASLLAAAGFTKDSSGNLLYPGTKTKVSININSTVGNPVRNSFMQLMQSDYKKNLGVTLNIVADANIFHSWDDNGTLYHGTFDIALFAFVTNGDCDSNTAEVQGDQIPNATLKTGQNYTGIQDSKIDTLLASQRGDTNFDSRVTTCKQMYDELAAQNFFEPLYIRANVSAAKETMQNYYPHPTLAGNQWNMADWGTSKAS